MPTRIIRLIRGPNLQQNETTLLIQKLEPGTFLFLPGVLESFHNTWKVFRWPGKFSDRPGSFQKACTVSSRPGKFPDGLERFQMAWKVFRWPGQLFIWPDRFLGSLESFQVAWKVFRWSGKFQMAWKVSKWPGKFPDGLESFQIV